MSSSIAAERMRRRRTRHCVEKGQSCRMYCPATREPPQRTAPVSASRMPRRRAGGVDEAEFLAVGIWLFLSVDAWDDGHWSGT